MTLNMAQKASQAILADSRGMRSRSGTDYRRSELGSSSAIPLDELAVPRCARHLSPSQPLRMHSSAADRVVGSAGKRAASLRHDHLRG